MNNRVKKLEKDQNEVLKKMRETVRAHQIANEVLGRKES